MDKTLKQELRELGVTQRELAEQMGLDESQVCNLLSDRVTPTLETQEQILLAALSVCEERKNQAESVRLKIKEELLGG